MHPTDLSSRSSLSRLLIVEDDPAQLRTLTDILADEGFTVCACATAAEALHAAAAENHVAAIIDLRLPDQEGTALVEHLREINPRVRVIIYTGYGSFGSAKDAINRGAFAYVEKLGDPAELIRHVQRAVSEEVRQYAAELELAVAQRTAELRESESRLRAVVEAAIDAILVIDARGLVDTFNPAAERLFGYSAKEVLGRDVLLLFPPSHHDEHRRALAQAGSADLGERGEMLGVRKDGSTFPVELGVSVMQLGARALHVEILRDLTERRRAEQERLLLERRMRQAQKMEALGTLAGGVAHDFNNILTGIRGFTDLVLHNLNPDSAEASHLSRVQQLTERATGLVKQILAFSRKRDQECVPADLRRVVEEALTLVRASVPATVEIRQHYPAEPAIVLADPTQLHQVVMNLCGNAAHAMRAQGGSLSLTVTCEQHPGLASSLSLPEGTYYCLSVRDTGHGMTPEIKERIFDPFFTTKEAGEGTGMGLAVVLGIIEGLGGGIRVESELNAGTCIEVLLPRAAAGTVNNGNSPEMPARGKGRIMLVDDETFILDWAKLLLRQLGYEVETFSSGAEGLNRFKADPSRFDAVITDQTMPRMTGAELVRELLRVRADVPVIMISGYSEQIDAERARALGARDFLMKPFTSAQLAESVQAALHGVPATI